MGTLNTKKASVLLACSIFPLGFVSTLSAQDAEQAHKVTMSSLLSQTIDATQATQATFDEQLQGSEPSNNIAFPPAVDISYSEVLRDIDQKIGTNIRWGGQVIESTNINDSTVRLTVYAYPLSVEGRPLEAQKSNSQGGRFIVNLVDGFAQGFDFKGHFLTFYGAIDSKLVVNNGNQTADLPVVNATEFVDWNVVDQNSTVADNRRTSSYYILGSPAGYRSHYYSPYYSFYNGSFGRHHSIVGLGFTNRQFSSHRRFSNSTRSLSNRRFFRQGGFRSRLSRSHRGFSSRKFSKRGFRRY